MASCQRAQGIVKIRSIIRKQSRVHEYKMPGRQWTQKSPVAYEGGKFDEESYGEEP